MSADASHLRQILAVDRLLTREQRAALSRAIALIEAADRDDREKDDTRPVGPEPERPR